MGSSCIEMDIDLGLQVIVNEFYFHWALHTFGFVPN